MVPATEMEHLTSHGSTPTRRPRPTAAISAGNGEAFASSALSIFPSAPIFRSQSNRQGNWAFQISSKYSGDQYETTDLYFADSETGNPFKAGPNTICNAATQTSFVAQLRRGMPLDIGLVYWGCLSSPSSSIFLPFYFGAHEFPDDYRLSDATGSESSASPAAYDLFWQLQHKVDSAYSQRIGTVRERLDAIETRAFALQAEVEQTARQTYVVDLQLSLQLLENFSGGLYLSAKSDVEVLLSEW